MRSASAGAGSASGVGGGGGGEAIEVSAPLIDPALLKDRTKAFEVFRQTYHKNEAIESNKGDDNIVCIYIHVYICMSIYVHIYICICVRVRIE